MPKILRPQEQILSDRDAKQKAWLDEINRAFKLYMLAHGRAPTNHIEYVQCILYIGKALYDKFGNTL